MPVITRRSKENEFKPVPAATYHLRCDDVKFSEDEDKDQIQLVCAIVDGPQAGKNVSLWFSMKEQAMWRIRQVMESIGVDFEEEDTGEVDNNDKPIISTTFDTDAFLGVEFLSDATIDTSYNPNKPQNRWKNERPVPGAAAASAGGNGSQTQQAPAAGEGAEGAAQGGTEAPARRRRVRQQ